MPGRRRAVRALDANRLSQAASRPGTDPRVWVALGRVLEWGSDAEGATASVQFLEGPLAGEPAVCEMASGLASAGTYLGHPASVNDIAVCLILSGDANTLPIIVGFVHSPERQPAKAINGAEIDLALLRRAHILADPHMDAEIELARVRVTADKILLAEIEPTQPFVRGKDFMSALDAFLDASNKLATTVKTASSAASAACVGPLAALKPFFDPAIPTSLFGALTVWQGAITTLRSKLIEGVALSRKIIGE